MKNKKAFLDSAFTWLFVMLIIFIIGVVYILIARPFDDIKSKLYSDLSTEHQITVDKITAGWKMYPLIIVFGMLIGGLVITASGRSLRRDSFQ